MKITAINDSHDVGFVTSIITLGEVYMADVKGMVTRVLAKADGKKITRLTISDHGNKDGPRFGSDKITLDNFEKFAPYLMLLAHAFAKEGWVLLAHCNVGQTKTFCNCLR